MPGGIEGLFNIFDYDDNLQFDLEDVATSIENYGLFTYEDFADLLTEEEFNLYPVKYLTIALAKNKITWEFMYYLIERYTN